jgi:hypothetical protein
MIFQADGFGRTLHLDSMPINLFSVGHKEFEIREYLAKKAP